ncbi:MAG TPA: hypothetical protein VI278_08650 [Nitrososphaeraceae archaeon]|jgi:hypothetical protein
MTISIDKSIEQEQKSKYYDKTITIQDNPFTASNRHRLASSY